MSTVLSSSAKKSLMYRLRYEPLPKWWWPGLIGGIVLALAMFGVVLYLALDEQSSPPTSSELLMDLVREQPGIPVQNAVAEVSPRNPQDALAAIETGILSGQIVRVWGRPAEDRNWDDVEVTGIVPIPERTDVLLYLWSDVPVGALSWDAGYCDADGTCVMPSWSEDERWVYPTEISSAEDSDQPSSLGPMSELSP